ncbi:MAG: response regulator [Robiginitomaculum sp.]
MSPDEILASNLWPWPDPLLKRDRQGCILFVNAAFLQLYGGRVEDWAGQVINGWPQPVSQGAQRFETRTGQVPAENVFDWIEMVMADGHAMAISRNVTALMAPPQPVDKEPAFQTTEQPTTPQQAQAPVQAPAQAAPELAPALNAQTDTTEVNPPERAPYLGEVQEPQPENKTPIKPTLEDTLNNDANDYPYEKNTPDHSNLQSDLLKQPEAMQASETRAVSAVPAPEPKTQAAPLIDRRTLPLENNAVGLGNNWRDQVIAKALGAKTHDEQPTQNPEKGSKNDAQSIAQRNEPLNILLAEDNAINALLTRTLLEAEGACVDVVEDGALAVEAARNNKYDLIFMDMRMPNMDGLESTRKIRSLGGNLGRIPIIALTANAFDDDRNACIDSGMNDFMTKPVSAEELSEMVTNWTKDKEKKLAS